MNANVPIQTFADILAAMARQPELEDAMRRHVLSQEILLLPATVAQLAIAVQSNTERLDRPEATVARLAETAKEILATIAAMSERQDRMESAIAELKAGQDRHEERLDRLDAGQAELKAGQASLEAGQAELKAGQASLEAGQAELKAGQIRLEGRVGDVAGTNYERRIARHARSIINRRLGLKQPATLQSINVTDHPELIAILENAVNNNVITDHQAYILDQADLIVVARDAAGEAVYVVAEVSETIATHDIDRARERATVMAQASGATAKAIVIGREISAANRQRADANDVLILIMTD